jgi:tetratricopeptide (TPR) repeat protein
LKFGISYHKEYLMAKRTAGFLLLIFILSASLQSYGQEKPLNPGELYDSSMELYYKGKCEEAIQDFSKIVQSAPASKLVSYSQYMIGLCYLKMEKYEKALQQLELYLKTYPEGDRVRETEKGIQIAKEQLKEKTPAPSIVSKPMMGNPSPRKRRQRDGFVLRSPISKGRTLRKWREG